MSKLLTMILILIAVITVPDASFAQTKTKSNSVMGSLTMRIGPKQARKIIQIYNDNKSLRIQILESKKHINLEQSKNKQLQRKIQYKDDMISALKSGQPSNAKWYIVGGSIVLSTIISLVVITR